MEDRSPILLVALLIASSILHALVYVALSLLPPLEELLAEDTVTMEVVEVEPEPEPEPEVEEVEEPEPAAPEPEIVRRRVEPTEEAPPPEPEPPPPQEEAIEEFAGVTLTNDGPGESWASNVGTGAEVTAPIGQPNAQVTGRVRHGVPNGVPGGTGDGEAIVAARDLSREPRIPDIDGLRRILRDNFPPQAQNLGIEGNAVVRIHVGADGSVRPLAVVSETYEGFGAACQRTLREGGRWDPPLDRQGHPVATRTTFRCTFSFDF